MALMTRIHHFDVGEGDAALVVLQELGKGGGKSNVLHSILIDTGKTEAAAKQVIEYCKRKLQGRGRDGIVDSILITHYDRDHIGGLGVILDSCIVNNEKTIIYGPKQLTPKQEAEFNDLFVKNDHGIATDLAGKWASQFKKISTLEVIPTAGKEEFSVQSLIVSDVPMEIEQMQGDSMDVDDSKRKPTTPKNRVSASFLITCGNNGSYRYYAGGDIAAGSEKIIAKYFSQKGIKINAYKISHHGSLTSTPRSLIDRAAPDAVAVISEGRNSHGLPNLPVISTILAGKNIKRLFITGLADQLHIKNVLGDEKNGTQITYDPDQDDRGQAKRKCAPGVITINVSHAGLRYITFDRIEADGGGVIPAADIYGIARAFYTKSHGNEDEVERQARLISKEISRVDTSDMLDRLIEAAAPLKYWGKDDASAAEEMMRPVNDYINKLAVGLWEFKNEETRGKTRATLKQDTEAKDKNPLKDYMPNTVKIKKYKLTIPASNPTVPKQRMHVRRFYYYRLPSQHILAGGRRSWRRIRMNMAKRRTKERIENRHDGRAAKRPRN